MFERENGIVTLCRAIDPSNKAMMTDTVKLVAAVCLLGNGFVCMSITFSHNYSTVNWLQTRACPWSADCVSWKMVATATVSIHWRAEKKCCPTSWIVAFWRDYWRIKKRREVHAVTSSMLTTSQRSHLHSGWSRLPNAFKKWNNESRTYSQLYGPLHTTAHTRLVITLEWFQTGFEEKPKRGVKDTIGSVWRSSRHRFWWTSRALLWRQTRIRISFSNYISIKSALFAPNLFFLTDIFYGSSRHLWIHQMFHLRDPQWALLPLNPSASFKHPWWWMGQVIHSSSQPPDHQHPISTDHNTTS